MGTARPRIVLAAIFWVIFGVLVLADWVHGAPQHNRFDEPLPWALGSGSGSAAKGAHCTAAPRK
jgi:hypothetical protein